MIVDFATFCYAGDAHRLHAPGQLKKQVQSNDYFFDNVLLVYQGVGSGWVDLDVGYEVRQLIFSQSHFDEILTKSKLDINKPQYQSPTDTHHNWKNHVVNHLAAIQQSTADYIVFADNDCWIGTNTITSWVELGIEILEGKNDIFIVSPNDGEPERMTQRISQQMFLVNVEKFRNMDFNQPGWDGNVNIPNGPMPEYHAMLEGRIHHYCVANGLHRYVLGPDYRYFHHNVIKADGTFDTDYKKLGWT